MLNSLRNLFGSRVEPAKPAIPPGERVYAVGDIHGRLDLFERLIDEIERDDAARAPAHTTMILLGDLVDRGPDSAGVIARARAWQAQRDVRILAGNHEQMFSESFSDVETLRHWLKHGGRETVLSYRPDEAAYSRASLEELQDMMHHLIPQADRDFVDSFEEHCLIGDYLFVHAGIKPDVPLENQARHDLLWIREPFLRHQQPHAHMIVHGHTICTEIDEQRNRIGIDTGAFRSGVLTAIMLEGCERVYLQAAQDGGSITVLHSAASAHAR